MRLSDHLSTRVTPQTAPIPGTTQVPNAGGGYAWTVSKWDRLHRFLILGSDGGTYYATERALTLENATVVIDCVQEDTARAIQDIVEISVNGRAPKVDPQIFSLAIACTFGKDKAVAYAAVPVVCRTGTHIFAFCKCIQEFGKWGRGLRRAVGRFYQRAQIEDLEYQLLKYKQRDGWTHRDVLRLSHPKFADPAVKRLLMQACGKEPKENELVHSLPERTMSVLFLASHQTPAFAVPLIKKHNLTREMIPSALLGKKEVWEALLYSKMPVGAMVRSLAKLTSIGLCDSNFAEATKYVVATLTNRTALRGARIHPLNLLVALRTYAQGHGDKGKNTWTPVSAIKDALDEAFYLSFEFVEPTGKNFCLGIDISASMDMAKIGGLPITPREAAAAMMMVTARTETAHELVFFSSRPAAAKLTKTARLEEVVTELKKCSHGTTDCSIPFLVATGERWAIDVFIVYTDNETNTGQMHPAQALRQFRRAMGKPQAKLIVVAMTSGGFTIADPNDAGMMDVAGFDTAVPQLIAEFSRA